MAFGFLKKIPSVLFKGLKAIDIAGDFLDDKVPFGKNVLLVIPVAGPYIVKALQAVDAAEEALSAPGKGPEKFTLAVVQLQDQLREEGHDISQEKLIALIENAVSVRNGEAVMFEAPEEEG